MFPEKNEKDSSKKEAPSLFNVFYWDGEIKGNWGHVASRIGGTYNSIWPKEGVGKTSTRGKIRSAAATTSDFKTDCYSEANSYRPDGMPIPKEPKVVALEVTPKEVEIINENSRKLNADIQSGKTGYCGVNLFGEDCVSCITAQKSILQGTRYDVPTSLTTLPQDYAAKLQQRQTELQSVPIAEIPKDSPGIQSKPF